MPSKAYWALIIDSMLDYTPSISFNMGDYANCPTFGCKGTNILKGQSCPHCGYTREDWMWEGQFPWAQPSTLYLIANRRLINSLRTAENWCMSWRIYRAWNINGWPRPRASVREELSSINTESHRRLIISENGQLGPRRCDMPCHMKAVDRVVITNANFMLNNAIALILIT